MTVFSIRQTLECEHYNTTIELETYYTSSFEVVKLTVFKLFTGLFQSLLWNSKCFICLLLVWQILLQAAVLPLSIHNVDLMLAQTSLSPHLCHRAKMKQILSIHWLSNPDQLVPKPTEIRT